MFALYYVYDRYFPQMLSAFQKKVAALAVTCFSIFVIGAFFVFLLVIMEDFLNKFGVIIWPLVAALIVSFMLRPVVDFISEKCKISRIYACAATFAAAILLSAAFAFFAVPLLVSELGDMIASIPDALQTAAHHLSERFPDAKAGIVSRLGELKTAAAGYLTPESAIAALRKIFGAASFATGGIVTICSFVAAFAVAPIYLFYILVSDFDFYGFLGRRLRFVGDRTRDDIVFCVRNFAELMTLFFRGQMLIALIMGLLFGMGLMLCGVKFGFILGFCAGTINVIPYLGTILGLGVILPVAFFQEGGGLWLCAMSLAVFAVAQLIEGYVLTPKIMGDRTGLHPAVIIFSVFFWGVALNGILGMILAIPLSAFVVVLWRRFLETSKA